MPKQYNIGVNRNVTVKRQDGELVVIVEETGMDKKIIFTGKRWAQFLLMIPDIDNAVNQLMVRQYVSYNAHIGAGWYASVSTGVLCIDLRQFYLNPVLGVRPTKKGIGLRLQEWTNFKAIIPEISKRFPNAVSCFLQDDHQNQEGFLRCNECNPFHSQAPLNPII